MTTRKRIPSPSNLSDKKMNHFKLTHSNTDKNNNRSENKRWHRQRTILYSVGSVQILYRQGEGENLTENRDLGFGKLLTLKRERCASDQEPHEIKKTPF